MERTHLLQQSVVLAGIQCIRILRGIELHIFHLAGLRHPAGDAQQVEPQDAAQSDAARGYQGQPLPASPEHPEGFGQEHGGGVVADGPRHQHTDGHGQEVVIPAILEVAPEQGVQRLTAQQGRQRRQAEAEHGLHPAHGHHVAGALAAAAGVQNVSQGQERHAHQGVDADEPEVFHTDSRQPVRLGICPGEAGLGGDRLIGGVHTHMVFQIHRGTQPLHHAGVPFVQAEDEVSGKHAQQPIQQDCQKVEQEVHGGQGEHVAHHESHKGGGGKVEEALPQHAENGHQQAHGVKTAVGQGDEDAEKTRHSVRDEHHGHTGEEIRHEQARPGDRQGVHQPYAAGVIEVAPHQHGAEDGINQGNDGQAVGRHIVIHLGKCQRF